MKLGELFAGIAEVPASAGSVEIGSLVVDSRKAVLGSLFAALPGVRADGAEFARAAVGAGASAVLAGRSLDLAVPCVVTDKPRRDFALASARFYGEPSSRFRLFGVTGTNGKTTTTYLVEQLATALGMRAGVIGTVETRWPGTARPSTHTTPESNELQALLAEMASAPVDVAAIEVSSHALAQERVMGCQFAGAAFTNLTRDHLDYHGTLENYFAAKARLFRELLPAGATAVVNLDDARCMVLAEELTWAGKNVLGFTIRGARPPRGASLLSGENLDCTLQGISFTARLDRPETRAGAPDTEGVRLPMASPLLGAHNAENLLAAVGLILSIGKPLALIAPVVDQARGAPGRLERVRDPCERVVLVDYAHSDDALCRALDALSFAAGKGPRLVCVFGCGGDRDAGKRPLMGKAAASRAHLTIATSDNPRGEDPLAILAQVEAGIAATGAEKLNPMQARAGMRGYLIVPDRRTAIRLAIASTRPGDALLIAGKGHEPYQIVGGDKLPFNDRVEAAAAIAHINSGGTP